MTTATKNKTDSVRYKTGSYKAVKGGMFASRPAGPGLETLAIMPRLNEAHIVSQLRASKISK